jgi:hypothetical protein
MRTFGVCWLQPEFDRSAHRRARRTATLYLERFNGSFKREAVDRLVLLGENHLRHVVDEYLVHYHQERNHQGRGGQIIEPGNEVGLAEGRICRRERLGGMFNYYYQDAA